MRRFFGFGAMLMAATVVAAACSSGGGDDSSSPTPSNSPGNGPYDMTIGATNWPHTSGGVRVLEGGTRVYCTLMTNMGATWSKTAPGILVQGTAYTVEVYGDMTTPGQYDNGQDHHWSFSTGVVSSDYDHSFDHNSTTQNAVTWPNNTGCP